MQAEKMAAKIRALRAERKLTQKEAADIICISVSAWAMYEAGERIPRDEVKMRIAKLFNTSVQNIFFSN